MLSVAKFTTSTPCMGNVRASGANLTGILTHKSLIRRGVTSKFATRLSTKFSGNRTERVAETAK